MVQVIAKLGNQKGKLAELLGTSLGQGIGSGLNTYFANRSLESVLKDKSLEGAPTTQKLQKLYSALSPYGETGKELLNFYMQSEQQESQKSQQNILARINAGQQLSAEDLSRLTPDQQLKVMKIQTPPISQRPIAPQQLDAIHKAHAVPGYDTMTESQKYQTLVDNQVSPENAIKEATLQSQQAVREDQRVESAYKAQKDFIDETTKSYKGFETEMKPRLLQMQHMNPADIVSPTSAAFLEALHIPLGALEDPSSELYNKLSQDLLKGLPETYGNRILKVEVDNFLKTIPTLLNSPDGRRMIASNMLKLGEMKEVYYNAMRDMQRSYLDANKPLPRDFEQVVFDQVKPQIDRINNEFVQMSDIKSVPPGTIPFFGPDGQIKFVPKEHAEWASQNGGRRIW